MVKENGKEVVVFANKNKQLIFADKKNLFTTFLSSRGRIRMNLRRGACGVQEERCLYSTNSLRRHWELFFRSSCSGSMVTTEMWRVWSWSVGLSGKFFKDFRKGHFLLVMLSMNLVIFYYSMSLTMNEMKCKLCLMNMLKCRMKIRRLCMMKSLMHVILNMVVFSVYGCSCTSKTFLWKTLLYKLWFEKKIVLNVAWSRIASFFLSHWC